MQLFLYNMKAFLLYLTVAMSGIGFYAVIVLSGVIRN